MRYGELKRICLGEFPSHLKEKWQDKQSRTVHAKSLKELPTVVHLVRTKQVRIEDVATILARDVFPEPISDPIMKLCHIVLDTILPLPIATTKLKAM